MHALSRLVRRSLPLQKGCHTGLGGAIPVTSIAAAARTPGLQALDLSRSEDLLCRNLVCERVGEPCICRLAVALERHTATLAWLSLAGNGLTQLPAALTALPALRYLDLSANGLSALPAGFTDLRSLQILNLSGNDRLEVPGFLPGDFPQLEQLHVDAHLQGWAGRMDRRNLRII